MQQQNELFLPSDWAMVSKLPDWAQAYAEQWPVAVCQAAMYQDDEPAGPVTPQFIEVYLNGSADCALHVTNGTVDYCDIEAWTAEQKATVIEVDNVVRFVEIEGRCLLNTLGQMSLPDCLISPSAQAQMILSLAK